VVLAVLIALAIAPASFAAVTPEPFWTRCAADTETDAQCYLPRGVAAAPATAGVGVAGNVFVADSGDQRIVEFTAWGQFVRTWGWDVVQSGPGNAGTGFEICVPADGDVCKAGTIGTGPGQFAESSPQGIAIDSAGNVYAVDRGFPSSQRVQKFDSAGHFLLMWGKGVNTGTAANKEICTSAGPPTDVCGLGGEGTGPGQFGAQPPVGSYISVDTAGTASVSDDKVYVGDQGRIQRFNAAGEYQADVPDPESLLTGKKISGLAAVPSGGLFVVREFTANVLKLNASSGAKEATCLSAEPTAVAADAAGNAYVVDGSTVRKFSSSCAEVAEEETAASFFPTFPLSLAPPFPFFFHSTGIAIGSGCLASGYDLYVSSFERSVSEEHTSVFAFGPTPDEAHIALCPPPANPPVIEDQGVVAIETDLAAVQARINPEFWKDTSYYVQYGTAQCIDGEPLGWEAPCVKQRPSQPVLLRAGATDVGATTAKVPLSNLTPATEYRFRFVAQSRFDRNGVEVNEKGGPVFGKGGTEALVGESASFKTTAIPRPPSPETCATRALRVGAGAFLPDCRAYEMVSPVDKNGGELKIVRERSYIQTSPDGDRITYTTLPAFGDEPSSKAYNQYLASRGEGGWSNHGINAPLGRQLQGEGLIYIFLEVGGFSPDLCNEWLADYNVTPLTPAAQEGYVNLFRQDLCGTDGFEALTTETPPSGTRVEYVSAFEGRTLQGYSADSRHALFTAQAKLTPDAAPGHSNVQIYDRADGALHLVSVLPGGAADVTQTAVGGGLNGFGGNLKSAVSADGSRVFWTSGVQSNGEGEIYLREHPDREQSALGNCQESLPVEPEMACTMPVSSSGQAFFWAAGGSKALYSEGSLGESKASLHEFDVGTETRTLIAAGVKGVLGTSEDLSSVYFVSTEVLSGVEPNDESEEAEEGEQNLYLDHEGSFTFIARLPATDVGKASGEEIAYNLASPKPERRNTRVSPDGAHLTFMSTARLTGFDNTDAANGKPDTEVFLYDAADKALSCVSCTPSGARPTGRELHQIGRTTGVFAAAWIPSWDQRLYASHVLSDDGSRLFFMSNTPLLRRDTNGAQDVYEWEAAGEGGCDEESAAYFESNGGCIYLISSGESSFESEFWDASPDGKNVFFTTESSLLPQDPGSVDLYDAREGGGFPQPAQAAGCEGEACQNPPAAPNDPTPASSGFAVSEPKPSCSRGKVRRKGRCVARKHRKHAKQHTHHRPAKHNRGVAR
jgi:hypothetical protein